MEFTSVNNNNDVLKLSNQPGSKRKEDILFKYVEGATVRVNAAKVDWRIRGKINGRVAI